MRSDPPKVSPDEVRAVARHGQRGALWGGAAITLGAALVLSVLSRVPVPEVAAVAARACNQTPIPAVAELPEQLQRLPSPGAWAEWRVYDVVQRLALPLARGAHPLTEVARVVRAAEQDPRRAEARTRRGVVLALAAVDPWVAATGRPGTAEALLSLADERDWSARAPALPMIEPERPAEPSLLHPDEAWAWAAGVSNRRVHDQSVEVMVETALRYADAREAAIRAGCLDAAASAGRARAAGVARGVGALGALAAALTAAILTAKAWRRGPAVVAVSAHHLQVGRYRVPWSEVVSIEWGPPVRVVTRRGAVVLDGYALDLQAWTALQPACQQALARAAGLEPMDRAALDAVRRLGSV